ncbi:RimK family alpha-L-glutamate ligase [Isoptericola sp. NPDC058082]|uniref:ATP-grasp domain-containing protein n=1 Tax=Isoptericola sp. NPDC058082 TaxID=3346331 RepID=UPI0036EDE2BD
MTTTRIGLTTCSALPRLDSDDRPLLAALTERGVVAEAVVWDDPDVDWSVYDLVVVRSTWDYSPRRDEFLAWARRVPRLENSADVLAWNTDKGYLRTLEEAGVPVIPTIWLDPDRHLSKRAVHTRMPAFGDFVVKPVVSAGAQDAGRYQPVSAQSRALAIKHAVDLLDQGRAVMIQPYVTSVDTTGETGLVFVDGELRHAVRKHALLTGPAEASEALYAAERMEPATATPEQVDVAEKALAVAREQVGGEQPFLYARVDLVTGDDGTPMVIELELTEPSLWMQHAGTAATLDAFADAIVARA